MSEEVANRIQHLDSTLFKIIAFNLLLLLLLLLLLATLLNDVSETTYWDIVKCEGKQYVEYK